MTAARRWLVASALVISALALAAPQTTGTGSEAASPLGISAGIGPAFSMNNGPLGFRVHARGTYQLDLIQKLSVRLGLGLGFQPAFGNNTSSLGFDLLPFGQALIHVLPELSGYFELGLGPTFGSSTATGFGTTFSSGYLGFGTRIGLGAEYKLSPALSVSLEPVGLLIQNVSTSTTINGQTFSISSTVSHYTVMVGATYRL